MLLFLSEVKLLLNFNRRKISHSDETFFQKHFLNAFIIVNAFRVKLQCQRTECKSCVINKHK